MGAFDAMVGRGDAEALIPEEVSKEIVKSITETNTILRLSKRAQDMATSQHRVPVLSVLPSAYFLNPAGSGGDSDTGRKKTTEVNWENVYLNAEEIAVIVPIPESVLDDSSYDIFGEVQPVLVEAFDVAVQAAIAFGTNRPASWPTGILAQCVAASHTVTLGAGGTDIYDNLLGESGVLSLIEEDGFMPTGHVAHLSMKSKLRGLRDANGQPVFTRTPGAKFQYDLDGSPLEFPKDGFMDSSQALLISGDWNKLVYAMRQDITWKILDQAVIQDSSGNIIYNLAQQDMIALRAVMRMAWALPNPANRVQPTKASRCQFAALIP